MPPQPLIDITKLDVNNVIFDKEAIRKVNPQRYEMEQLDAIIYVDTANGLMAGLRDMKEDEFWVKGHIPGRPLFPGVLMIESAAQLASFYTHKVLEDDRFIGFGGVDEVKFRGAIVPPAKLIIVGKSISIKPRRSICYFQGFVDNKMVFEAKITGMPV